MTSNSTALIPRASHCRGIVERFADWQRQGNHMERKGLEQDRDVGRAEQGVAWLAKQGRSVDKLRQAVAMNRMRSCGKAWHREHCKGIARLDYAWRRLSFEELRVATAWLWQALQQSSSDKLREGFDIPCRAKEWQCGAWHGNGKEMRDPAWQRQGKVERGSEPHCKGNEALSADLLWQWAA